MKKKISLLIIAAYIVMYVSLSITSGDYYPRAYGLDQADNGEAVIAPKEALGYRWCAFKNEESLLSSLFQPLSYLDNKFWHNRVY